MKLKCIGGPCDGQNELIDRVYIRIGDAINVIKHKYTKIEDFDSYKLEPTFATVNFHVYIIDCMKYSHKQNDDISEIWFLRPDNLTTFDCIQLQFLK